MRKRSEITPKPPAPPLRLVQATPVDVPEAVSALALTGDALLAEADAPVSFVIDKLIEAADCALVSGREKASFKTYLLIDLSIAILQGAKWLGFQATSCKPRHVLYIVPDSKARLVARRFKQLCIGRGLNPRDVAPFVHVVSDPITFIAREERERVFNAADRRTREAALRMVDAAKRRELATNAEVVGERAVDELGDNLEALAAIEEAGPNVFGLVVVDTFFECLRGDDNKAADVRVYTRAAREIARATTAPVFSLHHNNKAGDESDSRSSRGSVQLNAAQDAIFTIDTTGEYPTLFFTLRAHEKPEPIGFELVAHNEGGLRFEVREPSSRKSGKGLDPNEVLEILREAAPAVLTETRIREKLNEARGGKAGGKFNQRATAKALDDLVKRRLVTKADVEARGKRFPGFRHGQDDSPDRARPKDDGGVGDVF